MAFSALTGTGIGGAFTAGDFWRALAHAEKTRTNFNDHEGRIAALEGGIDLATGVTGHLPLANLPTNFAQIFTATVTLTDAQVKALPTTPITVVAAPGANKMIQLVQATVIASVSTPYTNLDATFCGLYLALDGGAYYSSYLADDPSTTPALSQATDLVGTASSAVATLHMYREAVPVAGGAGYVIEGTSAGFPALTDVANKALKVHFENNGSGNLTGGTGANTLRIVAHYFIVDTV